ncbi:MAG: hypothetical protein MGG11_06640 [Trichodesmium sp. MAG_R03]|jgi:hypothetical protein|nr:hypothetical protein [Trichodesmium sp. MAG_R03]
MMLQSLCNFIKRTSIISAIGSSLMIITISQAGGPAPGTKAPVVNQQKDTFKPSDNRGKPVEAEPKTNDPIRRQPPIQQSETIESSSNMIKSDQVLITLRLINQTGAIIQYQVIGGPYLILGETSVVELSKLSTPITLTYQRPDGGLILVRPQSMSSKVLEVIFHPTEDLDLDTRSLNISAKGQISLN